MTYVSKNVRKNLNAARKSYGKNPYDQTVQNLAGQIASRPEFTYDASVDPQYQLIQQQYQAMGQQAMQDTMAQAATLSGGYGNSYSQTAGQQVYDGYIKQAADNIPELYKAAYSMYQDEGNNLMNQLSMYQSLADSQYARRQDRLNYWQGVADNARNFNYQKKTDTRNFKYQKQQDKFNNELALKNYELQKAATEASINKANKKTSGKKSSGKGTKKKNTTTKKTGLLGGSLKLGNKKGGLLK